jgi:aryl-alcohol dehydrogenase-like predicted oxidoreductase
VELGIGTVQFGSNYGVSNLAGQTPISEVGRILQAAAKRRTRYLDTAPLYGGSEQALGETLSENHRFRIVTKTSKCSNETISPAYVEEMAGVFAQSLAKLRQPAIYGLMLHDALDLLKPGGERIYEQLLQWKSENRVSKIGVSVYSGEDIERILSRFRIDIIQVPINVIDQRLILDGSLIRLKQAGVEIHCRSVFLQGLLLMPLETVPEYFRPILPVLENYHKTLKAHGISLLHGAFAFIRSLKEIDAVICGVNDLHQLNELWEAFAKSSYEFDFSEFSVGDKKFINPSNWRL